MRFAYPILLDVSDRLVVIVGGGRVAARKAHGLLAAGATRVRVVAPQFDASMPVQVERICESYSGNQLEGAGLVFAATDDPHVNSQVVQDATRRGILVGRADEDEDHRGDFASPAVHRDRALVVAVSAGSAAVSAAARDAVAGALDPRWARLADALCVLRPRIRDRANLDPERRAVILRELGTAGALEASAGGAEAVWAWLLERHAELAGPTR